MRLPTSSFSSANPPSCRLSRPDLRQLDASNLIVHLLPPPALARPLAAHFRQRLRGLLLWLASNQGWWLRPMRLMVSILLHSASCHHHHLAEASDKLPRRHDHTRALAQGTGDHGTPVGSVQEFTSQPFSDLPGLLMLMSLVSFFLPKLLYLSSKLEPAVGTVITRWAP